MKKREEWNDGGWSPGCVVLMTLAMVAGLMLASCGSAKKMSSDAVARDSMHRERREVAADSLCQKAMRDRVLESAEDRCPECVCRCIATCCQRMSSWRSMPHSGGST